jgi:hypothetical protein
VSNLTSIRMRSKHYLQNTCRGKVLFIQFNRFRFPKIDRNMTAKVQHNGMHTIAAETEEIFLWKVTRQRSAYRRMRNIIHVFDS